MNKNVVMEATLFGALCVLIVVLLLEFKEVRGSTNIDRKAAREQVLEMFQHGFNSYMTYAYPADELMPLSCAGRVRGQQPSRGDIDDALGKFSLTLIDSLDTLAVLGMFDEFEDAVERVIHDVTFDTDIVVSVFETNIRVLGGLLGGHVAAIGVREHHNRMAWYKDELLYMAKDLGFRLLPAFNTTTGVPYPRVNLRHGIGKDRTEKDTCTACAGSMLLEFSALSRLTGDMIFEDKAKHVMHTLWAKRQRTSNLMGTVINIHTGDWVRKDSGVGAGIDSYYEYLLKGYILLGDEGYYERFTTHYDAIMTYINKGPNFIDVHMHRPQSKSRNFMDALFAFWPGLQVLFGDIAPAIKTHEMLYQVTQRHKFLPEAFTPEYDVYWGQHPLRPEFVESTYFLYKATNDPYYLEVGKNVMDSLEKYARVPCGFAGIKDVRTGSHEDRMDSFVLAETFKYLYLLFSEPQDLVLPIDDYLFTTEAHILPLTLANYKLNTSSDPLSSPDSFSKASATPSPARSCPSHDFHFPTGKSYADAVRESLPKLQPGSCPSSSAIKGQGSSTVSGPPRLKASEFVPGNSEHMKELGRMGIQLVTLDDGRVQLMHSASKAKTPTDAEEGLKFMQEIIEITKTQQAESVEYHPRVVQLVSPPNMRNMVLAAGPAQFGMNLDGIKEAVIGTVVEVNPFHGCNEPENAPTLKGKIVIAKRGNCMFIEKARMLEKHGAIAAIIMDNNESSSSDTSSVFAMSGDGQDDVNIPVVFLFFKEGKLLLDAVQSNQRVDVVIVDKARSQDEIDYLYIQLKMSQRFQSSSMKVQIETPESRYYTKEDEAVEQSAGKASGLELFPTDNIVVADVSSNTLPDKGVPGKTDDQTVSSTSKEGDIKEQEEIFVKVTSVHDLLRYAGQDANLYLVNEREGEGSDMFSKVDPQDLQLRIEKILFNYMASDKGQSYQQDQQSGGESADSSKDGKTQMGGVVAPEDMEMVLQQIQQEFMKLETIRNAFNKVNPNQDAVIPEDGFRTSLGDSSVGKDEGSNSQSAISDNLQTASPSETLSDQKGNKGTNGESIEGSVTSSESGRSEPEDPVSLSSDEERAAQLREAKQRQIREALKVRHEENMAASRQRTRSRSSGDSIRDDL